MNKHDVKVPLGYFGQSVADKMNCPYCNGNVLFTTNDMVYVRKFGNGLMFLCVNYPQCDSYCGAHNNGKPLGTLANKETRMARNRAHQLFDPIWKPDTDDRRTQNFPLIPRRQAYNYLAEYLGINPEVCHIANFDIATCNKVVEFVNVFTSQEIKNWRKS